MHGWITEQAYQAQAQGPEGSGGLWGDLILYGVLWYLV